eukprot:610402-Amphidinium_carterae.1
MPSAFSFSSGSSLGVGCSGSASTSSATASGTKPGSDSVSSSPTIGLFWGVTESPPPSGLTWRAEVRRGSTCRQLSGGGQ